MDEARTELDPREARRGMMRVFSQIGWGLTLMMLAANGLQVGMLLLARRLSPEFADSELCQWLLMGVPLYLVGIPLFGMMVRDLPVMRAVQVKRVNPGFIALLLPVIVGANFLGGLYTLGLNGVLEALKGDSAGGASTDLLTEMHLIPSILVVCLVGPLLEEVLFRGWIMERLRPYGSGVAILASSIAFMLMHGNTYQSFNVLGAGLVLAFLAEATGSIKSSVILHMLMNSFVLMLQRVVVSGNTLLTGIAGLLMMAMVAVGLTLGAVGLYRLCRSRFSMAGARHTGAFFLSPGVLTFTLLQMLMIVFVAVFA